MLKCRPNCMQYYRLFISLLLSNLARFPARLTSLWFCYSTDGSATEFHGDWSKHTFSSSTVGSTTKASAQRRHHSLRGTRLYLFTKCYLLTYLLTTSQWFICSATQVLDYMNKHERKKTMMIKYVYFTFCFYVFDMSSVASYSTVLL